MFCCFIKGGSMRLSYITISVWLLCMPLWLIIIPDPMSQFDARKGRKASLTNSSLKTPFVSLWLKPDNDFDFSISAFTMEVEYLLIRSPDNCCPFHPINVVCVLFYLLRALYQQFAWTFQRVSQISRRNKRGTSGSDEKGSSETEETGRISTMIVQFAWQ